MFYNCTSLISIPDINDWNIPENIDIYLMFYNCISLINYPNSLIEKINKIYINNYIDLGFLITEYNQNGKEILLKTKIESNEEKIDFYGNKLIFQKGNIL